MDTVFFWIVWGVISFWALKTFYYSFSQEKIESLRKTALGFNLATLILTLVPTRLPTLFSLFIFVSIALFTLRDTTLLKLGAVLTILDTLLLFFIMVWLRPGTFSLARFDVPSILATLLLLINCVVVLLLWQQLDLKRRKN